MYVHEANLIQKEHHQTKYNDPEAKQFLAEIRKKYNEWRLANDALIGPLVDITPQDNKIIETRVEYLNAYKDFIDKQKYAEKFDSRSNLHSTVIEEFMFYLFEDLVKSFSETALIGKAHTFKDLFFQAVSFREMLLRPNAKIENKDHDFVIGVDICANMNTRGETVVEEHHLQIPAIAIECKTYLDKTMLEGASTAAEQLKSRNPDALYVVVAEWLKLTESVNLNKFAVDQIYVLRKQKNTDREYRFLPEYEKNPIYSDVVQHLFTFVRKCLSSNWESGIAHGLERGYLI